MDVYVEKTRTGLGTNLKNSIVGVLVGILLFLGSFVVLWINEGRLDMSKVAKKSEVLAPGQVNPAMNGKWVSLTAKVDLMGQMEDPIYLQPGAYLSVRRKVEMYAWVEKSESKEEKKTGGSTETTTTYTYYKEWTSAESVKTAGSFKIPSGHENPVPGVKSDTFYASQAMIGGYSFDPKKTSLPDGGALQLTPQSLKPGFLLREGYVYIPSANTMVPTMSPDAAPGAAAVGTSTVYNLGDIRISFEVLPAPTNATIFGAVSNGTITEYDVEDGSTFLRLIPGEREAAIKLLAAEHTLLTWILRLVGFLMMWIGMQMFFGPLQALMDILPFLGSASRFLVGVVLFPIALVLSIVTILLAIIFYNIYLLIAVLLGLVGFVVWRWRSKKA